MFLGEGSRSSTLVIHCLFGCDGTLEIGDVELLGTLGSATREFDHPGLLYQIELADCGLH